MNKHFNAWALSFVFILSVFCGQAQSAPTAKQQQVIENIQKIIEEGKDVNTRNNKGAAPLIIAVDNNLPDMSKLLIEHGADVNILSNYHWSSLMYAVRNKNTDIIAILLENGAEVNEYNNSGQTPLLMAVEQKQRSIVKQLLAAGAETSVLDSKGKTVLDYAAKNNDTGMLKLLVDNGVDVNMVNAEGRTCFTMNAGAFTGNGEFLKPLLALKADPRIPCVVDLNGPLFYANLTGETAHANALRRMGVADDVWKIAPPAFVPKHYISLDTRENPEVKFTDAFKEFLTKYCAESTDWQFTDEAGNTFLHWVAENNCPNLVEWAIGQGMDVNVRSAFERTPLHRAAKTAWQGSVRVLLEYDADIQATDFLGNTPLHYAVPRNWTKVTEMLLAKDADMNAVNHYNMTPLHYAIGSGGADLAKLIQMMLASGADPTIQDFKGETILHIACKKMDSFPEVVQDIIRKGADVNQPNKMGQYPLHLANRYANLTTVLIKNGADLEARNRLGLTPLTVAVMEDEKSTIQTLLEAGADVNTQSTMGWTPLHYAAWKGSTKMIQSLFDYGADLSAETYDGKTVTDVAKQYKQVAAVKLIDKLSQLQATNPNQVAAAGTSNTSETKAFDAEKAAKEKRQEETLRKQKQREIQRGNWMYGCKEGSLAMAVLQSDSKAVRRAVDAGADLNEYFVIAGSYQYTALFIAVNFEDEAMVRLLVELGADINLGENEPSVKSPLHEAAEDGSMKMTRLLVELGADINAKDTDGATPFERAVLKCKRSVVQFYQSKGFDLNQTDDRGRTFLHNAVQWGPSTVRFLLEQGLDANAADKSGRTALYYYMGTAGTDKLDTPKLLVEYGANVNVADRLGNTPLCEALARDKLQTARYLIENGADVNVGTSSWNRNGPAIHLVKGNLELAQLLVEHGADVHALNKKEQNVIHSLVRNSSGGVDDFGTLDYFLNAGVDINAKDKDGQTPIFCCIESQRVDLMESLIANGADLEAVNLHGRTPLWHAVRNKKAMMVKILLEHGASTDIQDKYGKTLKEEIQSPMYVDMREIIEAHG